MVPRMFVERLIAVLASPQNHLGDLDDTLIFEADAYRALLSREAQRQREAGLIDDAIVSWIYTCIADGWVDEHLQGLRDALIELGAVTENVHMHRLLVAAARQLATLRAHDDKTLTDEDRAAGLTQLDRVLLSTTLPVLTSEAAEVEPLGLRLFARRYALEIGLLCREDGAARRTPLGDAVLALPRQQVPAFLLALETLQSTGAADRWRAPRDALRSMRERREFWVATTPQARSAVDPSSLLPWRRIRRLHVMGLVEPVKIADLTVHSDGVQAGESAFCFRLSVCGVTAVDPVLREVAPEIVRLADALLETRTESAVRPLFPRSGPVLPATHLQPPPLLRATELTGSAALFAQSMPASPAQMGLWPHTASGPRFEPLPALPQSDAAVAVHTVPPYGSLVTPREALLSPQDGGAWQDIDVAHLIQRAWEDLQLHRVDFALRAHAIGGSVRAVGDRRTLLQAWRELLRGAADAALQGQQSPPSVSVELAVTDAAIVVHLHDSGQPLQAHVSALGLGFDLDTDADADADALPFPGLSQPEAGPRLGMWRASQTLTDQGAQLALVPARLGGATVRVTLPRLPRHLRHAA